MIDTFLKMMEDDSEHIDIKSLFKNKKEQNSWEKMVNIFETIEIDNVSEGERDGSAFEFEAAELEASLSWIRID